MRIACRFRNVSTVGWARHAWKDDADGMGDQGRVVLNCSCTVFCPCVVSLGAHPPTEGHCHAWMAIAIDEGHFEGEDLSGLNVGLLVDIPGRMGEGNWKVGGLRRRAVHAESLQRYFADLFGCSRRHDGAVYHAGVGNHRGGTCPCRNRARWHKTLDHDRTQNPGRDRDDHRQGQSASCDGVQFQILDGAGYYRSQRA